MKLFTDSWITCIHTGNRQLPIVGGSAEHTLHCQRILKDRFVPLKLRDRSDRVPSDFTVVSEIKDPRDA
jgi:hypothetical protein